jgi:putative two-component system response regulator
MERPTLPIFRKIILVVEDHADMREIVTRSLEIEGYIVHQAGDGRAALDYLQNASPDLILSDIHMPNMDGIEFYKVVSKNPRWVAIPFIFLTSSNNPEDIQAGRLLGVEDYLTKPINHNDLVKIINARLLRASAVQFAHMDRAYLDTVNVLANSIEGRDPYTHGHVERVSTYARWIAEELGWPEDNLRMLEFGARLHDIGKIIVPDNILKKSGPLTGEEWTLMKQHTIAGAKIIRNINHLQGTLPFILSHHERWDGSGYPEGKSGREIPIEGRLLAIADVYDALTTARPYHPARPQPEVILYLKMMSSKEFDPDLIEIFLKVLKSRGSVNFPFKIQS